jgi:hypothetical protein
VVRFYTHLERQFLYAKQELLYDLVLLYFVSTCLLKKNGREVLELAHHIAPRLREQQALLDDEYRHNLELYEQQERAGLLRLTQMQRPIEPERELDVLYRALELLSPRLCDEPTRPVHYVEIADTRQAWGSIVAMLNHDDPPDYQQPVAAPAPVIEEPATETEEAEAEPAGAEPELPVTPEGVEQEAAAAQAEADRPAAARIKASVCAYHRARELRTPLPVDASRLCTDQCLATQIGAPLSASASASTASAQQTRTVQQIASRLGAIGTEPMSQSRTAMTAVVSSMAQQTPRARRLVLQRAGVPAQIAAATGSGASVRSASEWAELMRPLCRIETDSTAHLAKIDELACACGWLHRPIGDRIARYATVYGSPDAGDAFVQMRWTRTPDVDRKIAQFKTQNPAVPLRTLQLVASLFE